MANRYNTKNPQRKISAGDGPKQKKAGSSPSVTMKPGPFPGCPGPCQPRDRSLGVKKVKTHNRSEGL